MIKDPEEPKPLPAPFSGKIEFRNVDFRYPDAEEDVLKDISFTALPGQTTAIIGSTGCGKSTVVNLVPRFFDVYKGAVLVDDVDVRDVRQHDLREQIGYTPQKGILFSGTVESNLRLADEEANEDILRDSIEIAQAGDFVFANPEGLQAPISQGRRKRLRWAETAAEHCPVASQEAADPHFR